MDSFDKIPRIDLTGGPTPVMALPRLSEYLDRKIWIKRDDCTALATGGNKARKLEYLMADALQQGFDSVVTVGGIQSNHARQTAGAAAKLGMECHLVLQDVEGVPQAHYDDSGNTLLNRLLAANIHRVDISTDCDAVAAQLCDTLKTQGKKPYLIPMGGSNAIGSLGYVRCAVELISQIKEQNIELDQIVVASGSAGTQAGLLAGFIGEQANIDVLGISVSRDEPEQHALVLEMLESTLTHLNISADKLAQKVRIYDAYYGPGYGIVNDRMLAAVKKCAQLEGLILDPVYTGKAMAGLIDLCQQGVIKESSNTLFIHTGGTAGLYAYQSAFE